MVSTIIDAGSAYTVVSGSQNTTIKASGSPTSNLRAMGSFSNGITSAGTLLPAVNQNAEGTAQYAGGIDINAGVCLCTGLITDNDSQVEGIAAVFGVGAEGPNNAQPLADEGEAGEADFILEKPNDDDFSSEVTSGFDATVLNFKITLSKPGFLRINFVHASDEFPQYALGTFNDTPLVFVGDENGNNLTNIIVFKDQSGTNQTLSLAELRNCGLLKGNLVAPTPASLPASPHADVGTPLHYNHEYGGFTSKMTRESACVLAPKTYTIKIVIQDVTDNNIDSATFFETGSLKLYDFLRADFNLDGAVEGQDFLIWQASFGLIGAEFTDGDANGDGTVASADLTILFAHYGATGGHKDFRADFNRDGFVDNTDFLIWQQWFGLTSCGSRFEGDADGDGDVDSSDHDIWIEEDGSEFHGASCGGGGGEQMAAGGGGQRAAQNADEPLTTITSDHPLYNAQADYDKDDDIDRDDVALAMQAAE